MKNRNKISKRTVKKYPRMQTVNSSRLDSSQVGKDRENREREKVK